MKRLDTTSARTAHDGHDPSVIAAYAAGDAAGRELAEASALVAGCGECAALHRDLRAIAAAMPVLTPPARSRDFRITAEQAAALRPAGARGALARLLAPLATARFAFAAPAGAGLAAIGVAGMLLSGGLGSQVMPSAANAPTQNSGAGGAQTPAFALPSAAPTADGATSVTGQAAPVGTERTTSTNTQADASLLAMVPGPSSATGPKQAGPTDAALLATPEAVIAPAPTPKAAPVAPMAPAAPAGIPPVTLVGALLAVAGLLMGGLRLLARSLA